MLDMFAGKVKAAVFATLKLSNLDEILYAEVESRSFPNSARCAGGAAFVSHAALLNAFVPHDEFVCVKAIVDDADMDGNVILFGDVDMDGSVILVGVVTLVGFIGLVGDAT